MLYLISITKLNNETMKLKFLKAEEPGRKAKATVHSTGKLGFSKEAVEYLGIKEGKSIQFAQDEENPDDLNLYAVVHLGTPEGAFRINKAGHYFYLNTTNLFDSLKLDYKSKKIIYDLVKIQYDGKPFIKMVRRDIKRKIKV
jgi:hypothetical protein